VEVVRLTLPWPPSVNSCWRNINGRIIISRKARAYKLLIQKLTKPIDHICLQGRLFMNILVYPPDKRKRDIDNLIKIVADSLQDAKYYMNDSQIDKIIIERMPTIFPKGKLEVELYEI
jgi:crossover junction endodeoxyribonuclease RusA